MKACPFDKPPEDEIVYEDELFRIIYNLKPIVPGHCLVVPRRHVASFQELSKYEHEQLLFACQKVVQAFEKVYSTKHFDLAIQNGKDAGQVVMHLHVHLIPRIAGDIDEPWIKVLGESAERAPATKEERTKQTLLLRKAMLGN